jgi:hypothetical protein
MKPKLKILGYVQEFYINMSTYIDVDIVIVGLRGVSIVCGSNGWWKSWPEPGLLSNC